MASKFPRGSTVYDKDGRAFVVEDVDGGMVYCSSENGAEVEFPEAALSTEPARSARSGPKREVSYERLKQSRHYMLPKEKLDRASCQTLLAKVERLTPGILGFAAYTTATRVLEENKDAALVPDLSPAKCRAVFDAAPLEARASLLANVLSTTPTVLVGMANVGEFLMRAMIEKGLAAHGSAFAEFRAKR